MTRFKKQEKNYSCGAAAVKNCIIALDRVEISERRIRLMSKTTKEGVDDVSLIFAIMNLGYNAEPFETKNAEVFKKHLIEGLKAGSKFVVMTDAFLHFIALVDYTDRHFRFVDSSFNKILQKATVKEFLLVAKNIDKFEKKELYYCIKISRVES